MKSAEWYKIREDFIAWDNEGHSNASQKNILDWFEERLLKEEAVKDELYEKEFIEWILENVSGSPYFVAKYEIYTKGKDNMTLNEVHTYWKELTAK